VKKEESRLRGEGESHKNKIPPRQEWEKKGNWEGKGSQTPDEN